MYNTIPSSTVLDFNIQHAQLSRLTLFYMEIWTQKVQTNDGYILNWVTSFSKAWVWEISNLQSKMIAYLILAHTIYLFVPICFLCMTDVKT